MFQKYCPSREVYYFCSKVVFMSDRIQELLNDIREKATGWHKQLTAERAANQQLTSELTTVKNILREKEEELLKSARQITELESKLEMAANNSSVIVSEGTGVSDEQIDELVKEIDYCLAQLKR